jgi:hypothetical protein
MVRESVVSWYVTDRGDKSIPHAAVFHMRMQIHNGKTVRNRLGTLRVGASRGAVTVDFIGLFSAG